MNILTAEELALTIYQPIGMSCNEFAIKLAKEFAKLHVEAALKEASEQATASNKAKFKGDCNPQVDKDSILNAYPLTNIK
jgi:hypothetical protein